MNVNGSRFHLLLGEFDWGRCLVHMDDDRWERLDDALARNTTSPPSDPVPDVSIEPAPFAWDARRNELRLQGQSIELGATPGETPLTLDARRAAAADRYGNIYWIDGDRRRLRVWSVGSDRESAFWPDGPVDCADVRRAARGDFEPAHIEATIERDFTALTVTEDHYLVVAFKSAAANGVLAFDLMAGGAPAETLWPSQIAFAPFDMAPRCGGGVWLLDRDHARVWELDRRLAVVSSAQPSTTLTPPETDIFQPLRGTPRKRAGTEFPSGIDLRTIVAPMLDAIAIETLGDRGILILDRNEPSGRSRIYYLRCTGDTIALDGSALLDQLAHDFVRSKASVRGVSDSTEQLFVATASGNQALAFVLDTQTPAFTLRRAVELFPLRRFGGRALLDVRGTAWYDTGVANLRWVPVVQQPRVRFREDAELITPILDGVEPQCVWDRVLLDACIPADARVEMWCRAADEVAPVETALSSGDEQNEVVSGWWLQPQPYLRTDGCELPWLRAQAVRSTQRETGTGTWELLLQNARGRYLQLKLRLSGNGTTTPRLRALRAWYPRFSYSQRFLPAVYREDPAAGDFLDRFLANMEGINTTLEGRIAQMQALLDPRCAPVESLDWLAQWFDLALDPNWEDWRRRLFIQHAMDFFRWRGTVYGLRLALALAFERCVEQSLFDGPASTAAHLHSIRIVESYLTRRIGALAAGDPGAATDGLRSIAVETLWSPQEGNAGLAERYAKLLGRSATPAEQVQPFALFAPSGAAKWSEFWEYNLGFVPSLGAAERARWQNFLQTKYADLEELMTSHNVTYANFGAIDQPSDWPKVTLAADDWRAFCAQPSDTRNRERWQDFLARRYRRIERLNATYHTEWPAFDVVPLPDHLPATAQAQTDWLQFEKQLMAMVRTAHRFTVLLPVTDVTQDPFEMERQLKLARRIVELEKPAHTVFDVRFYWALNRLGEARLGIDTLLDVGSRAPQLLPDAILGRAYIGASFVGGPPPPQDGDRRQLAC